MKLRAAASLSLRLCMGSLPRQGRMNNFFSSSSHLSLTLTLLTTVLLSWVILIQHLVTYIMINMYIYMWASALCICFYINPALLNGSTQFHLLYYYCVLVTREPEQMTLLFWSAARGVMPHGLHTADRR